MPVFDQERVERLKQILKWHPRGITVSDLSTKMEMNRNLVAKYLDILLISGQVEMQVIGAAKVYFLSQRIPISSMLEYSTDMLIILDHEQKIMQVNEPVLVQVNKKRDALVGRNIKDIDHPLFRAIPVTIPSKATEATQETVHEIECTIEGKKRHYKVKSLQTAFEDGSRGITLIIEDITAQITYQNMLELNEARYRGIVEDQSEFITRFLPDGAIVFVNEAYARYLKKNKTDLLGGPFIPDIDSDSVVVMNGCIQSLDVQNPVKTFECRIHHSCGQFRWNLWTVRALFDDKQKPVEYQGVGRDNTEKREAAARINQYIRDMEFLSRESQVFVELSPDTDIFQAIAQGLSEIIPDTLITVNLIDGISDTLTVRAVLPDRHRELLTKCLGKDLQGSQFNISTLPEELKIKFFSALESGKLVHIEENLHTILFQQVPLETCDRIRKSFDLGEILYTIGLTRHGILFGNISVYPRKDEHIHNSSIIETFIRQASIVLHRRFTEDALKASESRYRGIVEDQTELITRFLPDGTLTYVNDSVCRYFQKDRAALLGRSIFSLSEVPEDDLENLSHNLHSLNDQNPVRSIEHRVFDPSGRIRWMQWTNRALFDDHGTIFEYQGVGRDITEQKEAEAKIRQYIEGIEYISRTSYEFLEIAPDADIYGTICRGLKGILPKAIVIVNSIHLKTESATTRSVRGDEERDVFSTLMGEDIIGKTTRLIKGPEGELAVKAVSSGRIVRVPGNLFFAMHRSVPEAVCSKIEETLNIGDIYIIGLVSQGVILANVVILLRKEDTLEHIDLIEAYIRQASIALLRCKTERTLKKSEKLYRSVIENIQDVFYRSDKDGNLTMASPSWARMLGYDSLDECIGYNIAEKFYFEPQQRKEFLETVYRNGSVSDYEVVLKKRDGRPLYVSTNSHLYYDDAGSLLGVEGIFRDISEHRIMAENIRDQISQLDFFSRALQEFIELSPDADIFEKIASDMKFLISDAMISVNSFDEVTGTLTCRSCAGDDDCATSTRYLGRDPRDMDYPIDPVALHTLSTGQLHKVPLSLYDILFRKIPKETCDQIEDAINIGDIYGIGFVRWGTLFGNATIFLHKGAVIPDIQLIENYARAASITLQRKIAEDSLKESQELFSSIAQYAPIPVAIIGSDGTYQYVNQKFMEIFGYDLNDIRTGREWFSRAYPDPEYRKNVISTWKSDLEASKNGFERPRTFTVRCKNGVDRKILFRPVTISNKKQCIVYEDITGERIGKQEPKLLPFVAETSGDPIFREIIDGSIISGDSAAEHIDVRDATKTPGLLSPHYLSNALKMARDYIAILDRSGKCVWVNDALVSVVNAGSCNDLAGKSIALYIAPEFRKIALNSLIEVKKNGNKTVPLMMLSSSGRVPVEANISAITTEEGVLFGYMAIARHVEQGKVEKPR
jgi:PAS domain S-box-containing protein